MSTDSISPFKRKQSISQPYVASSPSCSDKSKAKSLENETDGFESVLSRTEKRKQRKVDRHRPQFQFDLSYFRSGKKIGMAHIRDLILYIVADGQKPTWIVPEHKAQITHTVVLFVPGLLPEYIGLAPIPIAANVPFSTTPPVSLAEALPPNRVPTIQQLFSYGCPTRAPGDQRRLFSVMGTLLSSPLSESARKRKEAESQKQAALAKPDSSPLLYLLSPNQMIDNDYRLPSYVSSSDKPSIPELNGALPLDDPAVHPERSAEDTKRTDLTQSPLTSSVSGNVLVNMTNNGDVDRQKGNVRGHEGWVETPQANGPPLDVFYPVLAIDCEMVLSEDGQELARVSVIDYQSGVNVFDELVKPPKPVTDYRTQWSGITPSKLSSATHTLSTIQYALTRGPSPLITPHTILLGHSLECDLGAIRLRHPLCIDTALLYTHARGPPYKPGLKWLVQRWLGREIQGKNTGHDSEEDARACVELLKMKMANGPTFGSFIDSTEPIFERMNRFSVEPSKSGRTSAVCDYYNPRAGYGGKATTAIKCSNDEEVLKAVCENAGRHDFVFARLMELNHAQGWSSDSPLETVASLDMALHNLDHRLATIHSSLLPNTALVILTGHSSPLRMLELTAKRQKWERLIKTTGSVEKLKDDERWLSEDDRELEDAVGAAREGMAYFGVKGQSRSPA
ncbi:MAG: hypothetical protein TREMPRED_005740 [Tremellales sp. Tagirdzhanova-0007]|nr:MAG: hypothetical protein TREMPRED_005740 [Tremellales sp. Tagirdzhanova-0007]